MRRVGSMVMLLTVTGCPTADPKDEEPIDEVVTDTGTPQGDCETREVLTADLFVGGGELPPFTCWSVSDTLRLDADDVRAVEVSVRQHLAQTLRKEELDDPAHLEELFLWSLKRSASPSELADGLDRVAPRLLSRSSTREVRLRRRKLIDELEALRSN